MDWVNSVNLLTQGQVIAVDGKTLWRSHDRSSGKAAIHMVSTWAMQRLGLGKLPGVGSDPGGREITAEITAIPELLNLLDLSGCIVAIASSPLHRRH